MGKKPWWSCNMWASVKKFLLDPVVFLASVALFTLLVIALLFVGECQENEEPSYEKLVIQPLNRPSLVFPVQLLVHPGVQGRYLASLSLAVDVWREKTNGRMNFTLAPMGENPPFDRTKYEDYPFVTVWVVDGNDKESAMLLAEHSMKMGGVSRGNVVALVLDNEVPTGQLEIAWAHELGHLAGIGHISPIYPALMNQGALSPITRFDLLALRYLYPDKEEE